MEEQESNSQAMSRHQKREQLFRMLFLVQFHPEEEWEEQITQYFSYLVEIPLRPEEKQEIAEKFWRIARVLPQLDEEINRTAEHWTIDRMSRVDLSILRLAIYEIELDKKIPVGVAISQAVQLANRYGGERSSSFINGLLGRLAREKNQKKGKK